MKILLSSHDKVVITESLTCVACMGPVLELLLYEEAL